MTKDPKFYAVFRKLCSNLCINQLIPWNVCAYRFESLWTYELYDHIFVLLSMFCIQYVYADMDLCVWNKVRIAMNRFSLEMCAECLICFLCLMNQTQKPIYRQRAPSSSVCVKSLYQHRGRVLHVRWVKA